MRNGEGYDKEKGIGYFSFQAEGMLTNIEVK